MKKEERLKQESKVNEIKTQALANLQTQTKFNIYSKHFSKYYTDLLDHLVVITSSRQSFNFKELLKSYKNDKILAKIIQNQSFSLEIIKSKLLEEIKSSEEQQDLVQKSNEKIEQILEKINLFAKYQNNLNFIKQEDQILLKIILKDNFSKNSEEKKEKWEWEVCDLNNLEKDEKIKDKVKKDKKKICSKLFKYLKDLYKLEILKLKLSSVSASTTTSQSIVSSTSMPKKKEEEEKKRVENRLKNLENQILNYLRNEKRKKELEEKKILKLKEKEMKLKEKEIKLKEKEIKMKEKEKEDLLKNKPKITINSFFTSPPKLKINSNEKNKRKREEEKDEGLEKRTKLNFNSQKDNKEKEKEEKVKENEMEIDKIKIKINLTKRKEEEREEKMNDEEKEKVKEKFDLKTKLENVKKIKDNEEKENPEEQEKKEKIIFLKELKQRVKTKRNELNKERINKIKQKYNEKLLTLTSTIIIDDGDGDKEKEKKQNFTIAELKSIFSKKKLFQYCEDLRPSYFGTFDVHHHENDNDKRSGFKNLKKLFKNNFYKLENNLNQLKTPDYNYDSGLDWYEPEDGESICSENEDNDDDEENKGKGENEDELDYEDGWLLKDDDESGVKEGEEVTNKGRLKIFGVSYEENKEITEKYEIIWFNEEKCLPRITPLQFTLASLTAKDRKFVEKQIAAK